MANELHLKAEQLRESEKFEEALKTYDEAIDEYTRNNAVEGHTEALLGKFLTYKHLYLSTNNNSYLNKAKDSIHSALDIITKHKLPNKYRAYFSLGELETISKNYSAAVSAYKNALKLFTKSAAEKGNYHYHLGEALYLLGNKSEGEKELFKGLEEILTHKETTDSFLFHVWLTGCHIKIGALFWKDKPELATYHLQKAKEIIAADSRLIIRKRQLEELEKRLN